MNLVGGRFPLFTVELQVTEGTPKCPAKFAYSASAESLHHSVMSHYGNSFEMLKGTRTWTKILSLSLSPYSFLSLRLSSTIFWLLIYPSIISNTDIVKIERRIMKKLFWAHSPVMQVSIYCDLYVRSFYQLHPFWIVPFSTLFDTDVGKRMAFFNFTIFWNYLQNRY